MKKAVLLTGAGGSIGKPLAVKLAKNGYHLIVTARDEQKATRLGAEIASLAGGGSVESVAMDMGSLKAIRAGAEAIKARHEHLHVLINNAAVYHATRQTTQDGFEAMFGINHLAPFLLTNLLRDRLEAAPGSRVVFVSMDTGTVPDFGDLNAEKKFKPLEQLGMVKAANIRTALHLAELLEPSKIGVFAVNPAMTRTTLVKEAPLPLRVIFALIGAKPETAAEYLYHVATSKDLAGKTGRFFNKDREVAPPKTTDDPRIAEQLWTESERLVGLS